MTLPPTDGPASTTEPKKPDAKKSDVKSWIRSLLSRKETQEDDLRDALEDYIVELSTADSPDADQGVNAEERTLITNILNLRDMTVSDVMIPRADIIAIDVESSSLDILTLLSEKQFSRIPVYRETLDDILGTIHIKDVLAHLSQNKPIVITELLREAPIISPSLPVINLILLMRSSKKHLAFVVDEYGGIDGLVSIGDLIESIIGKISDEHEESQEPHVIVQQDNGMIVDGRLPIEELEKQFGNLLDKDERDDIDTLAGFLFSIASRVPGRGEIISHDESGLSFEILEADPRRVGKVRIHPPKDKTVTVLDEK